MANLNEKIELMGGLGNYSVYKMKGSDKIIIRKKGGPKPGQVLKAKNYERTRENMAEFSGVGKAVKAIRFSLVHVKRLADYNFTSTLTQVCGKIKKLDKTGDRGQRSILLSQHHYMLESFRLNRKHPFQSIVTSPVNCTFNRETKSAVIQVPRLIQGINLHLPWKQPLYRFSLSLALVPDIVYENGMHNEYIEDRADTFLDTPWHAVSEPFQSQTVELKLNITRAIKDSQTLVFAIGIEMGTLSPSGQIEEVKHAGSACIMALG
jgi:hypothetical protein